MTTTYHTGMSFKIESIDKERNEIITENLKDSTNLIRFLQIYPNVTYFPKLKYEISKSLFVRNQTEQIQYLTNLLQEIVEDKKKNKNLRDNDVFLFNDEHVCFNFKDDKVPTATFTTRLVYSGTTMFCLLSKTTVNRRGSLDRKVTVLTIGLNRRELMETHICNIIAWFREVKECIYWTHPFTKYRTSVIEGNIPFVKEAVLYKHKKFNLGFYEENRKVLHYMWCELPDDILLGTKRLLEHGPPFQLDVEHRYVALWVLMKLITYEYFKYVDNTDPYVNIAERNKAKFLPNDVNRILFRCFKILKKDSRHL